MTQTRAERAATKAAYYQANKERAKNKQREYYARNAEARRAYQREYAARDGREAANRYSRDYYYRTRDSRRAKRAEYARRKRYGMEPPEWDALVLRAQGSCELCGTQFVSHNSAVIDHCHTSGAVRGLVCATCNVGLGGLGDTLERALLAVEYLKRAAGYPVTTT